MTSWEIREENCLRGKEIMSNAAERLGNRIFLKSVIWVEWMVGNTGFLLFY